MLQFKNIIPQFLRCAVGDGQRASFWYDYCLENMFVPYITFSYAAFLDLKIYIDHNEKIHIFLFLKCLQSAYLILKYYEHQFIFLLAIKYKKLQIKLVNR